jgi:hypothetical protein
MTLKPRQDSRRGEGSTKEMQSKAAEIKEI